MSRISATARAILIAAILPLGATAGAADGPTAGPKRPNVLLVVADDQGYGDLGFHGNPQIRTPRLDALARQSARFRSFSVSPVCSPTRASLMTGRYSERTGVVDTFRGRSLMHPDEVTLAEILGPAGYRTGIFGKWHLGDNAPFRPIDQGFGESLVHRGGGIGQGFEPPGGGSYFDTPLMRDGREERARGYCADAFTDAAIRFVEADPSRPFFAVLAFNTPHEPLEAPERYLAAFRGMVPDRGTPGTGHALPGPPPAEATARVYAMMANLDDNLGRMLDRLDALGLARDTIVVYLSDNGPAQVRYNAGLLDRKGSVHEGGIRVPCFVRWPAAIEAGRVVGPIAAHIDVAPTLLSACGVARPEGVAFDGRDLMPLLRGEAADWPERTLYFRWHRGDVPEPGRAFAARSGRFKLVQPRGVEPGPLPAGTRAELYDMAADPLEERDVADRHPEVVAAMLRGYEEWFRDVAATRRAGPTRIHLGSPREDPATLTRQDWRGAATAWGPEALGGWDVEVLRPGTYDLTLTFAKGPPGLARFDLAGVEGRAEIGPESRSCRIEGVAFPAGPGRLRAWVERPGATVAAYHIGVHRRE